MRMRGDVMKNVIFDDNEFKLEAENDEFGNMRLIQTFKQGIHSAADEILLSKTQQQALKDYLANNPIGVQAYHINVGPLAELTEPSEFYLTVDRERDVVVLAAVNYDFSVTMSISKLSRDAERIHRVNLFSAEMKAHIVQQIVAIIL